MASGKTVEECRVLLKEILDEWIILSFKKNLPFLIRRVYIQRDSV
jgi:predicted RNase H-like HicB family nuclease